MLSLGQLEYTFNKFAGSPVKEMVILGTSATFISFDLFQRIGHEAGIPTDGMQPPDMVQHGNSQRPIPIGDIKAKEGYCLLEV